MDKGNDKPEHIGPLRRTEGEGTGNITLEAEYEWHFTCDLQPRRRMPAVESIYLLPKQIFFLTGQWSVVIGQSEQKNVLQLHNPSAGIRILYRHPVYIYITCCMTCYVVQNLASSKICQYNKIWLYNKLNNTQICHRQLYHRLYMPLRNTLFGKSYITNL